MVPVDNGAGENDVLTGWEDEGIGLRALKTEFRDGELLLGAPGGEIRTIWARDLDGVETTGGAPRPTMANEESSSNSMRRTVKTRGRMLPREPGLLILAWVLNHPCMHPA